MFKKHSQDSTTTSARLQQSCSQGSPPYPDLPRLFPACAGKPVTLGLDKHPSKTVLLSTAASQDACMPTDIPAAPLQSESHSHLLPHQKARAVVSQKKFCSPISTNIWAMNC